MSDALDTAPADWSVGEVVTAAKLNSELRDKVNAITNRLENGNPSTSMTDVTSIVAASAGSGWTISNAQYLVDGGWCEVYLTVAYSGTISPPSNGNLANLTVGTMPAPARPRYGAIGLMVGTAGGPADFYIDTDGTIGLGGTPSTYAANSSWNVTGVFHI